MDYENLREHHQELLNHLFCDGYAASYIREVKNLILWILKNEKAHSWQSYVDVYHHRSSTSKSKHYKRKLRHIIGTVQQFDLYREFPNRKNENRLIKRGAYHLLAPKFKEVADYYKEAARAFDLKESYINSNISSAACFLYFMQKKGIDSLDRIGEDDVLAFFLDCEGNVVLSGSYKRSIASVFKLAADWKKECSAILSYLPQMRSKRKNIQFLTQDEVALIHSAISEKGDRLSLREKAIGNLLFYTGARACDIAEMKLGSVNWEAEEIYFTQQKTGQPLVLPLTAIIGNSIHDYLENERPQSNDNHLFLAKPYPHYPVKAGAVYQIACKIYDAASIRQGEGDRRGSHLFRHNVATSLLGNGIPRPVISQTLGHTDPLSLEPYLHADFVNLKTSALSVEGFPVREGVFAHE